MVLMIWNVFNAREIAFTNKSPICLVLNYVEVFFSDIIIIFLILALLKLILISSQMVLRYV
jgi:hypothetical protein